MSQPATARHLQLFDPVASAGADGRPHPDPRSPLRGRTTELHLLREKLRRTRAARTGHGVVLTAAPGLGRSAVLHHLGRHARDAGVAVAAVTGQPSQQSPLEPLLLALCTGQTPVLSADAVRAVAALSSHRLLQVQLLERLLRRHVTWRSLLVTADDSHWLDPESRWMLVRLPGLLRDAPVLWVHSLPDWYADSNEGRDLTTGERVPLAPLSDDAVVQLAVDRLGHLPDTQTCTALRSCNGNPTQASRLIDELLTGRRPGPVPAASPRPRFGWAALTDCELKVARLVAEGHSNRSVAAALFVSPNTVSTHLRSVFSKLDVNSRVQMTRSLYAHEATPHGEGRT